MQQFKSDGKSLNSASLPTSGDVSYGKGLHSTVVSPGHGTPTRCGVAGFEQGCAAAAKSLSQGHGCGIAHSCCAPMT